MRYVTSESLWHYRDWRIKRYALTLDARPLPAALFDEAQRVAADALDVFDTSVSAVTPRVGWLTLHLGVAGRYALLDWWVDGDIVQHRIFGAPALDTPLAANWPPGAAFCAWELAVCWHERQAWVRHALSGTAAPDVEAYLADLLDGWV